jgi:hypothetical protein
MSYITKYPMEDGFETTLAQEWDWSTGKVYCTAVPQSVLPSWETTFIIVSPNRWRMQLAEVDWRDSTDNSFNVTNITLEKWAWLNYTQQDHGVWSVVRISDNFEFWKHIKDSVNDKLDIDGKNGLEYADTAARDAALWWDGVATENYRLVKAWANYYNYNLTTNLWEVVDTGTATPNASTTAAWVVEIATDGEIQAETDVWSTGAFLVATPSQLSPTKLTTKSSVAGNDVLRIADSADSDKAKKVTIQSLIDASLQAQFMFWPWTDWDVTISTNTTLSKDMYYNNLTINSWVTLNPAWYRIYVKWKLTNNGTIARNGNNGGNGTNAVAWSSAAWWTGAAWLTAWSIWAWWAGWNWANWVFSNSAIAWAAWTAWWATTLSYSNVNWVAWWNWWWWTWWLWWTWWGWWTTTRWSAYNKIMNTWEMLSLLAHPNAISNIGFYVSYNAIWWSWWWASWWSNTWSWSTWGWGGGWSAWWIIWIAANELENNWTIRANWGNWGNAGTSTGNINFWWSWGWGWGNWWVLFLVYKTIPVAWTQEVNWWTWWTWSAWWWTGTAWANGTAWAAGTIIAIQI